MVHVERGGGLIEILLRNQLVPEQLLGALQIGTAELQCGLPFVEGGGELGVVEGDQKGAGFHLRPLVKGNPGHHSFGLRLHLDRLVGRQGTDQGDHLGNGLPPNLDRHHLEDHAARRGGTAGRRRLAAPGEQGNQKHAGKGRAGAETGNH